MKSLIHFVLLSILLAVGCGGPGSKTSKKPSASKPRTAKPRKRKPVRQVKSSATKPGPRKRLALSLTPPNQRVLPREPDENPVGDPSGSQTAPSQGTVSNADEAVSKAVSLIESSLKYGPTLVVWLIDQSPSAGSLRMDVARTVRSFYQGQTPPAEGEEAKLLSAVVAFGEKVNFALGEPSADGAAVSQALDGITADSSGREMGFSAVKAALDRYLKLRKQGREVLFIVATDEAANDAGNVEQVLEAPRKFGLPIYVIGPPAPLGRAPAWDQTSETPSGKRNNASMVYVRQGPESRYSERIALEFTANVSAAAQNIDSGFGPFGWEWLCRESGGRYLTVRSSYNAMSMHTGFGWDDDGGGSKPKSSANPYPYDTSQMRTRAPNYVSEAQYQKILSGNAACMALHQAARLPMVETMRNPLLQFAAGNEAQMKRDLDSAQTEAARLAPDLERIYTTLVRGEKARDTIKNPRWQASYDLAMGRVLAAKVRVEGYNVMLAALKRGRKFQDSGSMTWILTPDDAIDEAGGKYRTMAKKAKEYLTRVVKQHPRTPWAQLAELELKSQIGWKWTEQ